MDLEPFDPSRLDPLRVTNRRTLMATLVLALTGPAVLMMADLHWRTGTGFDGWKFLHLVVFAVLFALVAFGAVSAVVGFFLRRYGGDPYRICASLGPDTDRGAIFAATAIVMPICNEDVVRVTEGLRVVYESLAAAGRLPGSDFFILSDSTNPNRWVEEEAAWLALTQQVGGQGRIFYRKRRTGINKKAGNIADFCRRWGRHYRYMIVLDADSIMTGEAIVRLVRLMEANPTAGIIQAVPFLANGETILARLQQFATRLYGPVSAAGLNFWQSAEGNYWGHNAIIRVAPFIRHCSLPELPGAGPFGGRIMSHDYVEAALMRRAGWQVWLATDLQGNYEECPANIIDFAKRDRRWLQGNLQHARLIVAKGFYTVNRLHFTLGILSYLASPLWLTLIIISTVIARHYDAVGRQGRAAAGFARQLPWSFQTQALGVFIFTMILLFVPKVMGLLDLKSRPKEIQEFGGWKKVLAGVGLETGIFTLLAPVLMLFHTEFIILTLCRRTVAWGAQRRGRAGESAWNEAIRGHWIHTVLGLIGSILIWRSDRILAIWMSPVLAGIVFSIPLSYWTGSVEAGLRFRKKGYFQTPEETAPPPELTRLAENISARRKGAPPLPGLESDYGLLQAVLDPYVNAVHVALLRAKDELPPAAEERFAALRAKLLHEGPRALHLRDKIALLMDVDSMNALHLELWATPAARLDDWWRLAIQHYTVIALPPQTPFVR